MKRRAASALRLGAEFHHNGLAIRCAQICRVPRGLAPAWDRERLSAETIALLRRDGDATRDNQWGEGAPKSVFRPPLPGRRFPAGFFAARRQ